MTATDPKQPVPIRRLFPVKPPKFYATRNDFLTIVRTIRSTVANGSRLLSDRDGFGRSNRNIHNRRFRGHRLRFRFDTAFDQQGNSAIEVLAKPSGTFLEHVCRYFFSDAQRLPFRKIRT